MSCDKLGTGGGLVSLHTLRMRLDIPGVQCALLAQMPGRIRIYTLCAIAICGSILIAVWLIHLPSKLGEPDGRQRPFVLPRFAEHLHYDEELGSASSPEARIYSTFSQFSILSFLRICCLTRYVFWCLFHVKINHTVLNSRQFTML